MANAVIHIPPEWAEAAEYIRHHAVRRVLVLGATDAGKSMLCRSLADAALRSGRGAALLDTDLGQKMIGPPACVSMSDLQGMTLAFVGTTNPVLGWKRLIEGTRRLAGTARADLLVINTSGLLAGPGRRLKAAKIDALQPNLMITLGNGPALQVVLEDHPGLLVLRLPPSSEARRKTDGEKRAARRSAFRNYFAGASVQPLPRARLQMMAPSALPPAGLLLGLRDGAGNDLGLGILTTSTDDNGLEILTPVAASRISQVIPGLLCLDESFSEQPASGAAPV